jgi:hypothetical protein
MNCEFVLEGLIDAAATRFEVICLPEALQIYN